MTTDKSEYKSVIVAANIAVTRHGHKFAAISYILWRESLQILYHVVIESNMRVSCPLQTKKSSGHATGRIYHPELSFNFRHLWF